MNLHYLVLVSYFICLNKFTSSKSVSSKDNILLELSSKIKDTQTTIKEFEQLYKVTKDEVLKFKDLVRDLPQSRGHTPNRFTQLGEPANESKIRESLYVTQLKRSTPQSTVSIDVKENVDDIVKNASNLISLTDEPEDNYFEEELHRMKMEEISRAKMKSLGEHLRTLQNELQRLITPKNSPKPYTPTLEKPENDDSVARVVCENSNTA